MLIYASSDPVYFAEHGEAFIKSAEKSGHRVQIDMVADFPGWRSLLRSSEERTFSALLRFLRLPDLLTENILVMDIDSIINSEIKLDDGVDMALFFRPWLNHDALRLITGATYWTPKAKPFAAKVRQRLLLSPNNEWGADQVAVWQTYQEMGDQFNIQHLDENFLSYRFDREAPIWTAKGPHRKSDPAYLERRAAYA